MISNQTELETYEFVLGGSTESSKDAEAWLYNSPNLDKPLTSIPANKEDTLSGSPNLARAIAQARRKKKNRREKKTKIIVAQAGEIISFLKLELFW